MIDDFLIRELAIETTKISKIQEQKIIRNGEKNLLDLAEKLYDLSYLARHEGLISLEEVLDGLSDIHKGAFLKEMIIDILRSHKDFGQLIKQWATRYETAQVSEYDALICLLMIVGARGLYMGEATDVLEQRILNLLPVNVKERYLERKMSM